MTQVVIVGAGMDTRAFRLEWPIRSPPVRSRYRRRVRAQGARPPPARRAAVVSTPRHGHEDSRFAEERSAVLGLRPDTQDGFPDRTPQYLRPQAADRLLRELTALASDGSWVGLSRLSDATLRSNFMQPLLRKLEAVGLPPMEVWRRRPRGVALRVRMERERCGSRRAGGQLRPLAVRVHPARNAGDSTRISSSPAGRLERRHRGSHLDNAARRTTRSADRARGVRQSGLERTCSCRLRNHTLKAEAVATFMANERGTMNVATNAAIEGDYAGHRTGGAVLVGALRRRLGCGNHDHRTVFARASRLHHHRDRRRRRDCDAGLHPRAADAERRPHTDSRRPSARHSCSHRTAATHAPAVIVVGGSDGGDLYTFVAALLAAHGMTALSLAYFGLDDLPKDLIEIPVEYFARGRRLAQGAA